MFEYVSGQVASKDPASVVIDCAGVGYRVLISSQTFDRLPPVGGSAKLLVHHSINSEAGIERLFGFLDPDERMLFLQLIEVQRVGPALAMRILSNAGFETLINAISGGDVLTLKRVKGVGAKMAERLVVELQEPLSKLGMLVAASGSGASKPDSEAASHPVSRDAVAALCNLGYRPAEAQKAVVKVVEAMLKKGEELDLTEVIRQSLSGA